MTRAELRVDRKRGFDHSEENIRNTIDKVRKVFDDAFQLERVEHPDDRDLLCFKLNMGDRSLQATETFFREAGVIIPAGWRISCWRADEDGDWREDTICRCHTLNNLAMEFLTAVHSIRMQQAGFEMLCECAKCRMERGEPVSAEERIILNVRESVADGLKSILHVRD